MNSHFPRQNFGHSYGVSIIAKDDRFFASQVLAVNRTREPSRLRDIESLVVDVFLKIHLSTLGINYLLDLANAASSFHDTHRRNVHIGHIELRLEIFRRHHAQLTIGNEVKPGAGQIFQVMYRCGIGNYLIYSNAQLCHQTF